MEPETATPVKRLRLHLSFKGAIIALAVGVFLPVLLSTAVGIVSLALGEKSDPLVVAVLVISFTATAIGGAVTTIVLLGRRARLVRQQADLLANVSHELRTPLSAIRMYAQTLLMGRLQHDPERTQQSLEVIIRETKWLEALIEQVLSWRSAAKDRPLLERHSAGLDAALGDARDRFLTMIAPEAVRFDCRLESRAPVLHDQTGIATLALNLLINAYKYTAEDKRICLRSRDEGDEAIIEVEDNGVGIARREQGRIFKPFYRVDSRLQGQAPGTGLGLAMVQHLVLVHGGRIEVDSEPNQGSCFRVRLPRAPGESET